MTAALILMLLAADGGTDVPLEEAGVYQVTSSTQADGGVLGPGWYLTPIRMQKVGEHIADLENAPHEEVSLPLSFWAGVVIGGIASAVTVFLFCRTQQ